MRCDSYVDLMAGVPQIAADLLERIKWKALGQEPTILASLGKLGASITWKTKTMIEHCELCIPSEVVSEDDNAYVRYDSNSLTRGHVIIVPKRHVASYFEMTGAEKVSVISLLDASKEIIDRHFSPDGYNIGVNIGKAAGQSRMHVHIHLIPRYRGDVANPSGGIRCVLARKSSNFA